MAEYNSFTYDEIKSSDFGVYIGGEKTFDAPSLRGQSIEIPGRNGNVFISSDSYENVELVYPSFNFEPDLETFRSKLAKLRNALSSRASYKRLTDTLHPDEFRMAVFRDGFEVKPIKYNTAAEFDIVFDCKPQRFLKSGEIPVEYTPGQTPSDEQTKTGSIVTFEAEEGTIISDVKADINPAQDLNGYDKPWAGGNGKNLIPYPYADGASKTANGITYTVNSDGSVKAVGTATSTSQFYLARNLVLQDGDYILTGDLDTDTGSPRRTSILFNENSTSGQSHWNEGINYPCEFTVNGYVVNNLRIRIQSGETVNQTFYPMIRKAEIADDTYEPYENICPISGWNEVNVTRTGKNLIIYPPYYHGNSKTQNGITYTVNSDGTITVNGTATAASSFTLHARFTEVEGDLILPNGTYTLSGCPSGGGDNTYQMRAHRTYNGSANELGRDLGSGVVLTLNGDDFSSSEVNLQISINVSSGATANNLVFKPMLVVGSTVEPWEPYNGNTYTIDLDGTRYGGTLDVTSGVLTVDMAIVDMGDLNYSYSSSRFQTNISGIKQGLARTTLLYASAYECLHNGEPHDAKRNGIIYNGNNSNTLFIHNFEYTSTSDFKTAMTGQTICYPLATPITVQLTPTEVKTLLGTNNIWADSGDITVKYGTSPYIIVNPTDYPSKPLLEVTGVGSFWLGDTQITITGTSGQTLYIDCETGECYKATGGIISPANGLVTLNRLDFPKLASGINNIQLGSGISKVKITPRWWRL